MFEPYTLMKRISGMPHGAERLREIKNAIQAADEASAHDMRLGFRFDYIKESIFHGDCYQAILSFPELVQIFDEHPELEDDNCQDLMQCFKWVVENLQDFYQVSGRRSNGTWRNLKGAAKSTVTPCGSCT